MARVISDGAAWGPKVLRQRTVIMSGAAAGPREELGRFRDQLAARAAAREPALFAVGDWDLQRVLTADVRAGTDQFRRHWLGTRGSASRSASPPPTRCCTQGTWQTPP